MLYIYVHIKSHWQLAKPNPITCLLWCNAYKVPVLIVSCVASIFNSKKVISGFSVADKACCGIGGSYVGQITCLPFQMPCLNRSQYVFWDAFHPAEVANAILAWRAFCGSPTDCYPINVQQMALL